MGTQAGGEGKKRVFSSLVQLRSLRSYACHFRSLGRNPQKSHVKGARSLHLRKGEGPQISFSSPSPSNGLVPERIEWNPLARFLKALRGPAVVTPPKARRLQGRKKERGLWGVGGGWAGLRKTPRSPSRQKGKTKRKKNTARKAWVPERLLPRTLSPTPNSKPKTLVFTRG